MNRFGYKAGVLLGLSLFSIGAIMFWPCARSETYAGESDGASRLSPDC